MDIPIDIANTVIETERLKLRAFTEADLQDLYDYASVPGVGEMAGWPQVLAVYHKSDRKVIGSIGIHKSWASEDEAYKGLKVKELGFVLSKDYWGRGLMPEAVRAVIEYGFKTLGLDAFTCDHFAENSRSRRVIEKCGFKFVKRG